MALTIDSISINNQPFVFKEDEDGQVVEYRGKQYKSLTDLVKDAAFLSDAQYLPSFVKIANFIFKGGEFVVIDDVAAFKEKYESLIKHFTQYGKYETSEIDAPKIDAAKGKAIFFAWRVGSMVPYKVTCTFPYSGPSAEYAYTLLKPA